MRFQKENLFAYSAYFVSGSFDRSQKYLSHKNEPYFVFAKYIKIAKVFACESFCRKIAYRYWP